MELREESKMKARERSRTKRSHLTPEAKFLSNRSKVASMSALRAKRRKIKDEEDEARYLQKLKDLEHELTTKEAKKEELGRYI